MNEARPQLAEIRRRNNTQHREVEDLHGAIAGKAVLMTLLWSIGGGFLVDWPWWRVLITVVGGVALAVLVVAGGSGLVSDVRWPRAFDARLRFMQSFFIWCALLIAAAVWFAPGAVFPSVTALLALLSAAWAWPPRTPPESDSTEAKRARLPFGLEERALYLPDELPPAIERSVEAALEDWHHLVEVLRGDPELSEAVAPFKLRDAADATLARLLEQSRRAAELSQIADERRDDANAPLAVARVTDRVATLEAGLHATTSALLRYVASQGDDDEDALQHRLDELNALAETEETLQRGA